MQKVISLEQYKKQLETATENTDVSSKDTILREIKESVSHIMTVEEIKEIFKQKKMEGLELVCEDYNAFYIASKFLCSVNDDIFFIESRAAVSKVTSFLRLKMIYRDNRKENSENMKPAFIAPIVLNSMAYYLVENDVI